MPFSSDLFDAEVEAFLRAEAASSYLDIGPGAGKYGRMIRAINPDATIAAIECDPGYIEHFKLDTIYDAIACTRIEAIVDDLPDLVVDVVVIGDMIEHLRKSEGLDLIHYLVYRCRRCVVVFPNKYVQYSWKGRAAEAHRSVWTEADFAPFEHQFSTRGGMSLAIITGFLADPEAEFGHDFELPEPLRGIVSEG